MRNVFSAVLIGLITLLFACEEKEGEDVVGQSNSTGASHNTGKNCMGCQFLIIFLTKVAWSVLTVTK